MFLLCVCIVAGRRRFKKWHRGKEKSLMARQHNTGLKLFSPTHSSSQICPDMAATEQYEAMYQMVSEQINSTAQYLSEPISSIQCPLCDTLLESRIFYQKHMNSEHRHAKALPLTCEICHMGFFSRSGLHKHIESHAGRRFACDVCNAKFTHKHHLKRHWLGVHKTSFLE